MLIGSGTVKLPFPKSIKENSAVEAIVTLEGVDKKKNVGEIILHCIFSRVHEKDRKDSLADTTSR